MRGRGGSHDFAYVHCDIPEGMTIRAWRAQRAAENIARRDAARKDRRRQRMRHTLRWIEVLRVPSNGARLEGRKGEA
jgi:hypothetical protein